MRVLIFILSLLVLDTRTYSQRELGSSLSLIGDVQIETVFVENDELGYWSKKKKNEMLAFTYKSLAWLRNEGIRRNNEFSFKLDTLQYKNEIENSLLNNRLSFIRYMNQLTNYRPKQYVEGKGVKNFFMIFFVKGTGRAFAVPINQSSYFIEYVVIYEESPYTPTLSESILAHEILHMFGAVDLYQDNKIELNNNLIEMFPNEIMLVLGDFNEVYISDYTAYKIGWGNEFTKEFIHVDRLLMGLK